MPATFDVGPFVKGLESKVARTDAAVRGVVGTAAHELERQTKSIFETSHRRGTPTPEPPGNPPSVITGTLRRSIKTEGPRRIGFGSYEAQVGPTVVYARVQELGGGPSDLPARPYLKPSYDAWFATGSYQRRLLAAVRGALSV